MKKRVSGVCDRKWGPKRREKWGQGAEVRGRDGEGVGVGGGWKEGGE